MLLFTQLMQSLPPQPRQKIMINMFIYSLIKSSIWGYLFIRLQLFKYSTDNTVCQFCMLLPHRHYVTPIPRMINIRIWGCY